MILHLTHGDQPDDVEATALVARLRAPLFYTKTGFGAFVASRAEISVPAVLPDCTIAADTIDRLHTALTKARGYVVCLRHEYLTSLCLLGPDGVILDSLTDEDREGVIDPLDALLGEIDEALRR